MLNQLQNIKDALTTIEITISNVRSNLNKINSSLVDVKNLVGTKDIIDDNDEKDDNGPFLHWWTRDDSSVVNHSNKRYDVKKVDDAYADADVVTYDDNNSKKIKKHHTLFAGLKKIESECNDTTDSVEFTREKIRQFMETNRGEDVCVNFEKRQIQNQ